MSIYSLTCFDQLFVSADDWCYVATFTVFGSVDYPEWDVIVSLN